VCTGIECQSAELRCFEQIQLEISISNSKI
jgi:hypothetical protein